MIGRRRANADRAHLVGREDATPVRPEVQVAERGLEPPEPGDLVFTAEAVSEHRGRDADDLVDTAGGASEAGHRDQGMAQRRDADGVEAVVDPNAAGPRERCPATP